MTDNLSLVIAPTLVWLAVYVWTAASLHAVFRKAGEEGWQAWVPVLNIIVLLRLGGFSGWWVLLLLIPGLGAIAVAVVVWIACSRINTAFGLGVGMTVLAIFLFPVWSSVVGWGSARWLGREQPMPGPVRSGAQRSSSPRPPAATAVAAFDTAGGDGAPAAVAPVPFVSAPLAEPFGSGGVPMDNIQPRPTSIPAAPPSGWPASPAPAQGIVTHVPSAGVVDRDGGDDDDDDAPPADYVPRRRSSALVSDVPGNAETPDPPMPAVGHGARPTGAYTGTLPTLIDPRDVPAGPRRAVVPEPDEESDELSDELVNETRDAPMPVVPSPASGRDPWAPPSDRERALRTPRYSPMPGDGFSETSSEVSAVVGAPALGAPMSARSSVSALRDEPELPDAESAFDETIIASRRRTPWMLHPPLGAPIAVTSDVLIVGRRPSSDPALAHAQLVAVADETRTMSKTHARLELHDGAWTITDLDSTNGVVLLGPDGAEVELVSGSPQPITDAFLLGDAELRLTRETGAQ